MRIAAKSGCRVDALEAFLEAHKESCRLKDAAGKLPLHSTRRLRNPLLELRPSKLVMIFDNFDDLFGPIFAHPGASRPQKSIPDGLTELRARNESSGACLGPSF